MLVYLFREDCLLACPFCGDTTTTGSMYVGGAPIAITFSCGYSETKASYMHSVFTKGDCSVKPGQCSGCGCKEAYVSTNKDMFFKCGSIMTATKIFLSGKCPSSSLAIANAIGTLAPTPSQGAPIPASWQFINTLTPTVDNLCSDLEDSLTTDKKCSCSTLDIWTRGCTCGAVVPYKQP